MACWIPDREDWDSDMKNVMARLNHGRWIVDCPDFPGPTSGHAHEVDTGVATFACSKCYPGLRANAVRLVEKGPSAGLHRVVPDPELRQEAFTKATGDDKVYKIIWPDDPKDILDILRYRRIENMNWEPGETLDFLKAENKQHGVGPTTPQVSVVHPTKG
jgi:hypothetical protein